MDFLQEFDSIEQTKDHLEFLLDTGQIKDYDLLLEDGSWVAQITPALISDLINVKLEKLEEYPTPPSERLIPENGGGFFTSIRRDS
jgi:hypothetical protein